MRFLLVIQNCVMSEIEHTRTLGKFITIATQKYYSYRPLKITTADAGDVLLRI